MNGVDKALERKFVEIGVAFDHVWLVYLPTESTPEPETGFVVSGPLGRTLTRACRVAGRLTLVRPILHGPRPPTRPPHQASGPDTTIPRCRGSLEMRFW